MLGGVKGALASLAGCAALDAACARCAPAFIDGVGIRCPARFRVSPCSYGSRCGSSLLTIQARLEQCQVHR